MRAGLDRIGWSALWSVFGLGLLVSGTAAAQSDPDMREIFPYVMLVIDTSGSMEYLPSCNCTTPGCTECLPDCDATDPEKQKNRWAVTLEALTGNFREFACKPLARIDTLGATYDAGYFLPYHQPWKCSAGGVDGYCPMSSSEAVIDQQPNGILDIYASQVRFGLMTFDGWDTYKGAPPLVKLEDFDKARSEDRPGLWSYGGDPKVVRYPGCQYEYAIDTGVRSSIAEEGSLVSLNSCSGARDTSTCPSWCDTCPATPSSLNTDIQEALLSARPYGGTPIAAALDDLYFHLKDDLTDNFGSCRNRFAILVTDGRPDADYRDLDCQCKDNGTNPDRCVPENVTLPDPSNPPPEYDPDLMRCPYPWPEDAARNLVRGKTDHGVTDPAMIERLFVVGLSVEDKDVLDRLNRIAEAGCTAEVEECWTDTDKNFALFADDLDALRANLSKMIDKTIRPISRSVPAFGTSGGTSSSPIRQFQISTGFNVSTELDTPWTGVIERTRYLCNGSTLEPQPIDSTRGDKFAERLNSMNAKDRDLWTAVPRDQYPNWDTVTSSEASPNGHLFMDERSCGVEKSSTGALEGCLKQQLDSINPERYGAGFDDTKRDAIVAWMRGEVGTPREDRKLGDIYHSSPVIVGPPRFDTADEGFNRFRQLVSDRPTMLYVSSNDGILHAFHTEDNSEVTPAIQAGEEAWGFVPPMMLNRLNDNRTTHQFTMDGTPVVKNVFFSRVRGQPETADYRTVLITGMRGGGRGYIALDVTNPMAPKFLWQFTDPQMGFTFAQPAIGQAVFQIRDGGTTEIVEGAVAILPGGVGAPGRVSPTETGECTNGATNPTMRTGTGVEFETSHIDGTATTELRHRADVRCWQDQGRALYFVEVATGRLLKKIWKDRNGKRFFPSPLVSTPAIYPADTGSLMTDAYVVDADGVIWRIDLRASIQEDDELPQGEGTDAKPADGWTARPFHDMFYGRGPADGELTYEAPILTTDEQERLVVIVGTGDNNNFVKEHVRNRVVSLTRIVNTATGITDASPEFYKASLNWEMRTGSSTNVPHFVNSELVTGTMGLFNGLLLYGSFIAVMPGGEACDLGKGRIHAVHYLERGMPNDDEPANPFTGTGSSNVVTYAPKQISVALPEIEEQVGINVTPDQAITNLMLMGLGLTQRPTCHLTEPDAFDVWGQPLMSPREVADPALYLVAQASGTSELIQRDLNRTLGNIELRIDKPASVSQVLSWASSVD